MAHFKRKSSWLNACMQNSQILVWYEKLTKALLKFYFFHNKCDHSLFIYSHQGITVYALVRVDDILLTCSSSTLIHELINSLYATFALKKLGQPEYFLGIEVKHFPNGNLQLTQTKYFRDLLNRDTMPNANGVTISMLTTWKLSRRDSTHICNLHQYRYLVGVL